MSDEQLKNEDVEGHVRTTEAPVEDKNEDEVEAHVRKTSPRKTLPRKT